MRPSTKTICGLTLAIAAAILPGCAAEDNTTTGDRDIVVEIDDLANKVSVYDDRLEFDADARRTLEQQHLLSKIEQYAADKAAEPVYLVGNRQAGALNADGSIKDGLRNRSGYLRRALSWSEGDDGAIVVMTEPATIADAIEEIKKNGSTQLKTSTLAPLAEVTQPGLGNFDRTWKQAFGPTDGFTPIDLSGKELFNRRLLAGGNAKLVLTKGRINLKPSVDARVLIQNFIPQNGHAVLNADVQGEIEFQATTDGVVEINQGAPLFSKSFGGVAAGVPLTMRLDVKWSCGVGLSGKAIASIGATARGSIHAGAEFEGMRISPVLDKPTYEFNRLGPNVNANVVMKGACHIVSEINLQVFDAVGPQVTVDLYSTVDANATGTAAGGKATASLKAGVEASVGGSLKPFGISIATINAPPFKFEREVFNGTIAIGQN